MYTKLSTVFLVIAVSFGTDAQIVSYCGNKELCPTTPHITCNPALTLSPSCPQPARSVPLSQANIQQIVELHNKHRNEIASGNVHGFPPAAKMPAMVSFLI